MTTTPSGADPAAWSRREFLLGTAGGIGANAVQGLLSETSKTSDPLAPKPPHFEPRARRVIYLHLSGGPPQQDLFDPKPTLQKLNGQVCPSSFLEKERFAFIRGVPKLLGSPYRFAPRGQCGVELSDLLPHTARIADRLTWIRSVVTDQFNHAPAELFLYTGSPRFGRPCLGSWSIYGLGTENRDLPAFVVLTSGGRNPSSGKSLWGSGFLPSLYQGCQVRTEGDPVLHVENPAGTNRELRGHEIEAITKLNRRRFEAVGDPEIQTRIAQFELAFRMQMTVPEATDLGAESASALAADGAGPKQARFARNCLVARRLVERGVRFVQLYDHGWDIHGTSPGDDLMTQLPRKCKDIDQPASALVSDLAERGLLHDTLVVCGGEFGRTPMNEERDGSKFLGRDHHPHAFSLWMAGAGLKPGLIHGEADELGYRVVQNPVHVHDLQATILHLLGLDHERLTTRYQGREFRLTDVHGKVVRALLA